MRRLAQTWGNEGGLEEGQTLGGTRFGRKKREEEVLTEDGIVRGSVQGSHGDVPQKLASTTSLLPADNELGEEI